MDNLTYGDKLKELYAKRDKILAKAKANTVEQNQPIPQKVDIEAVKREVRADKQAQARIRKAVDKVTTKHTIYTQGLICPYCKKTYKSRHYYENHVENLCPKKPADKVIVDSDRVVRSKREDLKIRLEALKRAMRHIQKVVQEITVELNA